jgi:hypothetical protein
MRVVCPRGARGWNLRALRRRQLMTDDQPYVAYPCNIARASPVYDTFPITNVLLAKEAPCAAGVCDTGEGALSGRGVGARQVLRQCDL